MIMIQRRFQNVIIKDSEICFTLENAMGAGGGNVPIILIVLEDQGGAVMHWNYDELAPTLRAQDHGHPPVVVLKNEGSNDDEFRSVCDD